LKRAWFEVRWEVAAENRRKWRKFVLGKVVVDIGDYDFGTSEGRGVANTMRC
jgi:hypothetical protein